MTDKSMNDAWGSNAVEKAKPKSNNTFMKLVKGVNRVRFIGMPVFTNILWHEQKKYIVPESHVARLRAMGYDIIENVSLRVIDRNESELQIKVIEKKPSVFLPVFEYSKDTGEGQGSVKDGQDWKIKVDYPGSDVRKTKYSFMPLGKTPLTKEEITYLKENKVDLEKMYDDNKALLKLNEILDGEALESENLDTDISSDDSSDETETEPEEVEVELAVSSDDEEIDEEDLF